MSAFIITGFLTGACLLFQKNRIFGVLLLVSLWLLFVFSTGSPDEANYMSHFASEVLAADKGAGYVLIVRLFNRVGLGYVGFKFFVGTLYLLVIAIGSFKVSKRPCLVFGLLSIFPFCMDAVQLRYTLAFSFVLAGFFYLYARKADNKSCFVFIASCLVGGIFHTGVLPFVFFVLAYRLPRRRVVVLSAAILLISLILALSGSVDYAISMLTGSDRYISDDTAFDFASTARMLVPALLWVFFSVAWRKRSTSGDDLEADWLVSVNLLLIAIVPLLQYAPSLFRLETSQFVMAYILAGNMLEERNGEDALETPLLIFIALLELGLVVLFGQNFGDVWVPFYFANALFP